MSTETEEQALCTSCGMCCDGTLFEFTPIETDEMQVFLSSEIGLFPLSDGALAMPQACHHLKNKYCDIYQSVRPAICGTFKCKLLKNFLRSEITYSDALELIQTTLIQRDQIREKMEQQVGRRARNLGELFKTWSELQSDIAVDFEQVSQLSQEYSALKFKLARNFKK